MVSVYPKSSSLLQYGDKLDDRMSLACFLKPLPVIDLSGNNILKFCYAWLKGKLMYI